MDDPKWLRFLTIGLVLAAVAVGYFLLSGRLVSNSATKTGSTPTPSVLGQNTQAVASPTPTPSPISAYSRIADRNQGNVQKLPATGFPVELLATLSVSVMLTGWGLRKFPK